MSYELYRFAGWQGEWLRSVATLSASGVVNGGGVICYGMRNELNVFVYDTGIVECNYSALQLLIPDEAKRAAFFRGDKDEFFS